MVKTKSKYHNTFCELCRHYFSGRNGLNLHRHTSRCGRIETGKLTASDIEMIKKYPGRYRLKEIDIGTELQVLEN